MENQLCFLTIFVSFLMAILMRAWWISKTKTTINLPPGPWKLPIIGNLHQFVGSLPHHRLRDLATKYGPIMHLQLGQLSTIIISSPELAKEILKTHDLIFSSRPLIFPARILSYNSRDFIFSPYGDYWRQLRKICTLELLSTKKVQSFRSVREEEVSCLVKSITSSAGAPVNLTRMLIALSYCIVSRTAFGKPLNQKDAFTPAIQKAVSVFGGFSICDLFPSIKILEIISGLNFKLWQDVSTIIEDIIREHSERKKSENVEVDNLVNVLLKLKDDNALDFSLTIKDIKAVITDIFLAGVETSSALIEWTMSELMRHPKVLKRAQEEIRRFFRGKENIDETSLHDLTYLNLVIKETLRLHPPAPLLVPREAREDAEICGYNIPEKTRVIINAWAIGRDPHYWTEPKKFNPERFLNKDIDYKGAHFEYIPFGSGRRICPGMAFGIHVVELVLANLLYYFDWFVPGGNPEDLDQSEVFGTIVRRKTDLYLIPVICDPQ